MVHCCSEGRGWKTYKRKQQTPGKVPRIREGSISNYVLPVSRHAGVPAILHPKTNSTNFQKRWWFSKLIVPSAWYVPAPARLTSYSL